MHTIKFHDSLRHVIVSKHRQVDRMMFLSQAHTKVN